MQSYTMNSEQQKKSSHIIIMNDDIKTIDNLPYTKALKYIENKIYELRGKRDWTNKNRINEKIKSLTQKRNEINKQIIKLEKEHNLLTDIFDENKQLKQELNEIRKQKNQISKQLQEEIRKNKYKRKYTC